MTTEFHGPFTAMIRVAVVNDEGVEAEITWSLPTGRYPTLAEMEAAQQEALKQAPSGLRLMTKREWWDALCAERFGSQYAMPGGPDWVKPS